MENGKIKVWLPALRAGSGVDIYTERLAEALGRQGITTHITWFPLRYEACPFLLRSVPPPKGTDIVIANSWSGDAFKRSGLPLAVIVHHSAYGTDLRAYQSTAQRLYHAFLIRPLERRSFKNADVISAVSAFSASGIKRQFPEVTHVEVIPNWLDIERFRPAATFARLGHPFRLLYVGKLSRPKGADLLAPIMKELGDRFELLIASHSPLPQDAYAAPNIRLLGWMAEAELIRQYQQCDALLLPSLSEGFSYAALEAMACGKPVVASNATALPELVIDNVNGILCQPGDIPSFSTACRALADNAELCQAMGTASRGRAVKHFSESAVVGRYADLIHRLVRK
jgi:glycosyltransferase involved in cell wall biosynthesis